MIGSCRRLTRSPHPANNGPANKPVNRQHLNTRPAHSRFGMRELMNTVSTWRICPDNIKATLVLTLTLYSCKGKVYCITTSAYNGRDAKAVPFRPLDPRTAGRRSAPCAADHWSRRKEAEEAAPLQESSRMSAMQEPEGEGMTPWEVLTCYERILLQPSHSATNESLALAASSARSHVCRQPVNTMWCQACLSQGQSSGPHHQESISIFCTSSSSTTGTSIPGRLLRSQRSGPSSRSELSMYGCLILDM